jgi:hypothetical protein
MHMHVLILQFCCTFYSTSVLHIKKLQENRKKMSSELIRPLLPSNLTALNICATFGFRLNLKPFTAIKGLSDQIRMERQWWHLGRAWLGH